MYAEAKIHSGNDSFFAQTKKTFDLQLPALIRGTFEGDGTLANVTFRETSANKRFLEDIRSTSWKHCLKSVEIDCRAAGTYENMRTGPHRILANDLTLFQSGGSRLCP